MACKASQVGWFDKINHEFAVRRTKEAPHKQDEETETDSALIPNAASGQANKGSPGTDDGTSGGSPATEEFLKAITYKPEMFKLWRDMDWMNQKEKHDPTKKNAWTHALETEWSGGIVNKVFFGAYLGKVSQHDKPVIEIGDVKMNALGEGALKGEDVFVTSDGLIKKLDDGVREHYLIEIHPESGSLGFARVKSMGFFGGKRRRKSHRKSHKKTQKKHKKQMKKSHKKVHKKKTRGKKC